MIENYIWDFDGMLFDTYPHTLEAFITMYKRHGVDIDRTEAMEKFKITMWDAFDYYGTTEEMREEFYEIENNLDFEPLGVPYPMIKEALRLIKGDNCRNFLYTHRDKVSLGYLERYSLTALFDGFVTRENGFAHKPAPDAIEYLIEKYALDKKCTMMLGDRLIDIGSGKNAGTLTCLFDEFGTLGSAECTWYCRSTYELFEKINKEINSRKEL